MNHSISRRVANVRFRTSFESDTDRAEITPHGLLADDGQAGSNPKVRVADDTLGTRFFATLILAERR